jgi:hypothetical protein
VGLERNKGRRLIIRVKVKLRVMCGAPSIRILINKICMAFRGLLNPSIVLSVISVNAAAAVLSWKDRKF